MLDSRLTQRVAVHGSYFARNFGDTLLVKLMCDWAAEAVGRENVFLAVPGHADEQREIGYPVLQLGQRADVTHLVFTGGGSFGEPVLPVWPRYRWYLRNYGRHVAWVRSFARARKAIFGIGVGPISDPVFRHSVRRLFSEMQLIYTRDAESLEYLRDYRINPANARLGIDLAMSLQAAPPAAPQEYAIHATSMPDAVLSTVLDVLERQFAEARRASVDVITDTPASTSLEKRCAALSKRTPIKLMVRRYAGVADLIERIAGYNVIFTSKLHVGIVATALGRKVISLPAHQKTARFYRDLSLEAFCLESDNQSIPKIAQLIEPRVRYSFDRASVSSRIEEMRRAIQAFLTG